MARKKTYNDTTVDRYFYKALRIWASRLPPDLAEEKARRQTMQWSREFGVYHKLYQDIKPVLIRNRVKSTFYGLYRSAAFQFRAQVVERNEMTYDEWINRWTRRGLDSRILQEIAEVARGQKEGQPPQPPTTG